MIRILPNFTTKDIQLIVARQKQVIEEALISRLQIVGENFIKNARSINTYKDKTGNLRSSIGYVILKNGLQLTSGGFIKIKQGGEGVKVGKNIIKEISQNYPTGIVLIGIAGMDYAAAVESKGFDVITGSGKQAEVALKKSLKALATNIRKNSKL